MNTKKSKGITGITLACIMITSIFAALTPAPVAAATITVNGVVGAGEWNSANWPTGDYVGEDPLNDPAIHGYDIYKIFAHYDNGTNTMYFRVDVAPGEKPADLDGNGDTDTDCSIVYPHPGDCTGVGPYEQYTLTLFSINGSYSGANLAYTDNTIALADGDAQWGPGCVEYSLANADTYIDPLDFCVALAAGGQYDGPGEDLYQKCLYGKAPPEIDFNYTGTGCLEVTFNAWAINDSIINWTWYFGPGASPSSDSGNGSFVPETVTFSSCGTKMVTLTACNDGGCDIVIKNDVVVACEPTAVIKADEPCFDQLNGTMITFDASDSYGGTTSNGYTYLWDFGNLSGDNDNGEITIVMVTEPITATLTVTDDLGCTNTTTRPIGPCAGCLIRIYGTFGQGAGDDKAIDPETELAPENWPYTDPVGPFNPQHPQAPRKDFITFNPAIMDHNQAPPGSDDDYDELDFGFCSPTDVQIPMMKVFKRMWYEKEWFKDHNGDGCFTVIIDKWNDKTKEYEFDRTVCLADYNKIPQADKVGERIREWNDDETAYGESDSDVDIYAPAIIQEFTYMTLDGEKMPVLVTSGSNLLIPMASWVPKNGIDSFDADGDGYRDAVRVESEATLGIDIDGDGLPLEHMDNDDVELSGDESVVLVLEKELTDGQSFQLFDHKVKLLEHDDDEARFNVSDNEGGGSVRFTHVTMKEGEIGYFYRGKPGTAVEPATFYVKLGSIVGSTVTVEVGRMFGQTYANIGANPYWNQKAFIVDGVFYNVVAIKALDDCFKFITFRQKLPKMDIKLYQKHLEVWGENEDLPEMPPFNEPHEVMPDVQIDWTKPAIMQDKIPDEKEDRDALKIQYVYEGIEERYKGELKEIYNESHEGNTLTEYWNLEWFHTKPWQYTEFRLPKEDRYLVTLSWFAPESEITLWDDQVEPVAEYTGERFKFWYEDCTGPLYIDAKNRTIRIYGAFDEGPGDHTVVDPETDLKPENPPYTDPIGPFHPQSPQAPKKDFMTFNPAIMDHNQGYPMLDFAFCSGRDVQRPKEKVFKRMWYEKEWFKDHNGDGKFTVVIDQWDKTAKTWKYWKTMSLEEWNQMTQEYKFDNNLQIREWNDDETAYGETDSDVDIYAPAINQEFTYMALDGETMPILIRSGSYMLIPMASKVPNNGIDSFDADGDGYPDAVRVESELTLDMDIDNDTVKEPMDADNVELSGDESVVFVLNKGLKDGDTLQFFDHKVKLLEHDDDEARFNISDNEGGGSVRFTLKTLKEDGTMYFYRARPPNMPVEPPNFYLKVGSIVGTTVEVEVGRMFGQTWANIGRNPDWNQKAFIVDGVFYNVVAIKALDDCFKFITFRQKLPKEDIKLYQKHLLKWDPLLHPILPEMPPFNEPHEIIDDIQITWTKPHIQQDKIGKKITDVPPLEIMLWAEGKEKRFKGQLMEIYNETHTDEWLEEYWNLEWFHTQPWQYTEFVMPTDQKLYLMTLAWYAPQAEITLWDDAPGPVAQYKYERVKFWYDSALPVDPYVNRAGEAGGAPGCPADELWKYYDLSSNYGDGQGDMDEGEVIRALNDFFAKAGAFDGSCPLFDENSLINYLATFLLTT